MTDETRVERLEEQRQNIVSEIERQERKLRHVELGILQAHSIHSDIGNGKKLILTKRAIAHIIGNIINDVKIMTRGQLVDILRIIREIEE